MYQTKKKELWHRFQALVLALCMALSLIPAFESKAEAAASDSAMDQLINWGVVSGYPDGQTHPERELTRAEFTAMVNRAYGYHDVGPTPFMDVPETSWYADDIGIAYNAGYFKGLSATAAGPIKPLTREESIVMLGRNMRLDPVEGEVTEFSDGHDFSSWSHGLVRAAARNGIIGGYSDGTFKPRSNITRGEMAMMLQRALGTLINQPGVHTLSDTYGNVTISTPNTTLKDSTIAGNLYLTGGLELGDITLDNVRVLGDIIVAGGGESQDGRDSIILRNVEADSLLVDSIADQYVSLRAEGDTSISETILRSDAYVQDRTRPGEGLLNITLESMDPAASFTLSGNLENVVNKTPNSTLKVAMGTVSSLTVDEHAANSVLDLDVKSMVSTLNLDTAAHVMGVGDIDKLIVNAPGAIVDMLPDQITVRPGITSEIAGETVDAVKALESSSDPRLLAGYPKLKNIAPVSATGLYAGNKAGTVYWAVSTAIDGSIPEEELIDPTQGNTRILLQGSVPIERSSEEVSSALSNLTPDTNYYLSAVMTDAHGRHSPVKVAAFATPDNTPPNFANGYPIISKNSFDRAVRTVDDVEVEYADCYAQAAIMPTKTCQLYYALYPTGSVPPTGQQFRTGSLGRPIQNGVEDVTKNVVTYIDFKHLDEMETYDLYLWLTDADGKLSSAVRKLTFKTVDGTPPVFQYETPLVSNIAATSIRLTVNVNEAATVYWVAVPRGTKYLKDDDHWEENAQRQIESGTNGTSRGNVKVKANTDSYVNVGGLKAASNYDIYFVAKDAAGNYSRIVQAVPSTYRIQASTLDTQAPTVEQEFVSYPEDSPTTPYANTDIYLVFSEDVMQFTPNQSKAQDQIKTFRSLYDAVKEAQEAYDAERSADNTNKLLAAKEEFGAALRATIKLYNASSSSVDPVVDRWEDENDANWVIDYREARIEDHPDKGTMMVVFPGARSSQTSPALKLASGTTYYFVVDDVCDTSTARNRMGRKTLPRFTTIAAQVRLSKINVTTIKDDEGHDIPIDMAFSLTPVSTNVESSVDWDILFWSDSSVSFQVYELNGNSDQTVTESYLVENIQTRQSSVSIINDDGGGYVGVTLFRHFYGLSTFNPSVTGQGNRLHSADNSLVDADERGFMVDKRAKYYGIHFTEVKHLEETNPWRSVGDASDAWDATINYKIDVMTGYSTEFKNLAQQNITQEHYDETMRVSDSLSAIHSPNPFTLRAVFTNREAPKFVEGFPQITTTDINASIRVMLDRAGTLYYAIGPVQVTGTEENPVYTPPTQTVLLRNDGTTATVTGDTFPDIPLEGNQPAYLSRPSPDMIYSPNFGNDTIQTGKLTLGTGYKDISLKNLQANTDYFVYFVTQGKGNVYSRQVMLYRFKTAAVNRPNLLVEMDETLGSSGVKVTSKNMDATGNFAVIDMSLMPGLLTKPFNTIISEEDKASISRNYPGYLLDSYTVADALTEQSEEGGSAYDRYASADHKESLRKLILQVGDKTDGVRPGKQTSLKENTGLSVDCTKSPYSIQQNKYYMFIAMARSKASSSNVKADAYGFVGYRTVLYEDTTPPAIRDIGADLVVDYTKGRNYVIRGTITLYADRDLYVYTGRASESGETTKVRLTSANRDEFGTGRSIRVSDVKSSPSGDEITLDISYSDTPSIEESWQYAENNSQFVINRMITSLLSTSLSSPATMTLNYDEAKNEITVAFDTGIGGKAWYPAGKKIFKLTDNQVITDTVYVKDIIVQPSESISIPVGKTATITATTTPDDATDRSVRWENPKDTTVATKTDKVIKDTKTGTIIGSEVTITGKKVGKTTITVVSNDGQVSKTVEVEVTEVKVVKVTLKDKDDNVLAVTGQQKANEFNLALPLTVYVTLEDSNGGTDAPLFSQYNLNYVNVTAGPSGYVVIGNEIKTPPNSCYFTISRDTKNAGSGQVTITVSSRDNPSAATATFLLNIPAIGG